MAQQPKRLQVTFYRTPAGAEPVRDWLKALPAEDRYQIGVDLLKVELGWPLGMPVCKALGDGLWEVRTNLSGNRTARVLFVIIGSEMALLSAFIKKTPKTPLAEIKLALKRKKEIEA